MWGFPQHSGTALTSVGEFTSRSRLLRLYRRSALMSVLFFGAAGWIWGTPAIGWYFVAFLQADSRGSFASIAAMKDAGGFQAERLRAMVAIFARAGDKSANRVIISPPLWRMKYST
jgi:hypothetical protein